MKKSILCIYLAVLLLAVGAVSAQATTAVYDFDDLHARLSLDNSAYDMVLTPATLDAHRDWLTAQGADFEQTTIRFEDDGVLLEAYDSTNKRTLVVTALADVNARELFDVNGLEDAERKSYRMAHSNGTFYGIQGIDYSEAKWKNYGGTLGRFLKLKYSQSADGAIVRRGYQRRTVRNGYTITFDMQVTGRSLKESDEKALDRALNGFTFLEILNSPIGACKLNLTTEPAREVTTEKVTIAGRTEDSAVVAATVISLTDNKTSTHSVTANNKGKFSMNITFPQQGTYSINLVATAPDGRSSQRSLSVMYQRDYIPINLKNGVPSTISTDSLEISGTTVAGVTVQISVSGPVTLQKSKTGKSFSFTVNTREEGTYQILITATKKDMSPRVLSFTAVRTVSDAEKLERVKKTATKLKYSVLKKSISKYAGKIITLSGWVMETKQVGGEYVVRLAVNRSVNTYKDFVYIVSSTDPALNVYDHVRMYGTLSENTYVDGEAEYPRFQLMLFEAD
ncbi:MAG: hypothetical protein IJJ80_06350 [Clostridia bacterium]|nr:hypothetical protein [Clostridia bacterium]